MTEWFVYLAPLFVLLVVLLFAFIGCQVVFPIDPDVHVELIIGSGCDVGVSSIAVTISSDINFNSFPVTLGPVPSGAFSVSSDQLSIKLEDEGQVTCAVLILPVSGSPIARSVSHEKLKDEPIGVFKLTCQNGAFDLA